MKQFTVIGKTSVYRVAAKSVQQLTQALRSAGIAFQAVHEDRDENEQRQPRARRRDRRVVSA